MVVARWRQMYRVSSDIWPDRRRFISVRKEEICGGKSFFKEKKEERANEVGRSFGLFSFIKDIDGNIASNKKEKKRKKVRNLKKNLFIYLFGLVAYQILHVI